MKFRNIQNAYAALKGVKINTLEVEDAKIILNFRKEARPHIEAFEAFLQDVNDSLKPEDFDNLVEIEKKLDEATQEEKAYYHKSVSAWRNKVNVALGEELDKDIDITFGTLSKDGVALFLKAKEWTVEEWESVDFLMG